MNILNNTAEKWEDLNLDYEGENKYTSFFSSSGNLHTYPAKAVPEMVKDLIEKVKSIKDIKTVLDPFVGSGTTALEAKYLGLDFWGSDLNPLAVLLSKTKALTIDNTYYTKNRLIGLCSEIEEEYPKAKVIPVYKFPKQDYWFKSKNIRELEFIKYKINNFIIRAQKSNREIYALILLTAFSSTIRKVSLTRNSEFKLYRMSPNEVKRFSIDAVKEFSKAVSNLLDMLVVANDNYRINTKSNICVANAKSLNYLKKSTIDMVITSPPYGDSKTTVAYGEFSKLSLQWMDDLLKKFVNINVSDCNCDEQLLGGKKSEYSLENEKTFYKSDELNKLILQMDCCIKEKETELSQAMKLLDKIQNNLNDGNFISQDLLSNNDILYQLIKERVRLDIYRKINNSNSKLKDKEIKRTAKNQADIFMAQLENPLSKKYVIRQNSLNDKVNKVKETIKRKQTSVKKRKIDVMVFMKDLYKVVLETDRVLKKGGFQVWIVGHRTVMEKIVINMEGVLKDWFTSLGYICEASLNRKYSFKRMPHHINSTIERCKEVNTMMNEYILVVRKN